MRWELTDEQVMFRDAVHGWLARIAAPVAVRGWAESGDPTPFERALSDDGWLSVGTPEALGGQGGGLIELALAAEELARHAAPSASWMASILALPALAGRPDLVESVLGGAHAAFVIDAGWPIDATPIPSVTVENGILNGRASNVLCGDRATNLLVPVPGDTRTLYTVDAGAAGVSVVPRTLLDRSRSVADVVLDAVPGTRLEVDADRVLGDAALRSAVLVAADALGAMDRMLELAVEYSKQRHQFGVPIGSFQAVKHAAATMLVEVESSRSIVYYAAASVEQGHEDRALHAAAAKAQATAAGVVTADLALTIHGAIGYTWEYDLQLFYKRAKFDEYLFGAPRVWNGRIADALPLLPVG